MSKLVKMLFAVTLLTSVSAYADPRTNCPCQNCACTQESNCGCMDGGECTCSPNSSCSMKHESED